MMKKLVWFFMFVILLSCDNNKTIQPFPRPAKVKLDSVTKWLNDHEHVNNKNYAQVFASHLKKQTVANNLDSATKIIIYTTQALARNYGYDIAIMDTVRNFLLIHDKNLSSSNRADIYNNLSVIYFFVKNYDSAISYSHKGIVKVEDYNTAINIGEIYNTLTSCYTSTAKYDSAIIYGQKAEQLFTEQKIALGLGACYDNMSGIYANLKDPEKQSEYLDKAIAIAKEAHIENGIIISYINRMMYKMECEDNKSALVDADTVMNYYRKFKITEPMISVAVYSAKSYLMNVNGDSLSSQKYLDTAQNYLKLQPENEQLDLYQLALLENYKSENSIGSHKKFLDEMLANSQERQDYRSILNIVSIFYQDALKHDKFQEAIKYNNMIGVAKDSLLQEHQHRTLFELDKKYQTAKKEKQISAQKLQLTNSKFHITALLLSLLGLVLVTLIFFGYRKRKNAQQEIIRQQEFTDVLIQNTEDERKRIASDLHDGVNHELLTLKNKLTSGAQIKSQEIDEVIEEVRQVSRDLYPAMFENIGLKASIEMLCERLTEAGLFTTCEINYQPTIAKRNELQLYRIIQEALNNTLKHAKANAAKVTIETRDNELLVEIKDNGIGFDANNKMNDNASFGLQSFLQRTRSIGGKSKIDSNANGTTLNLTAPLR